MSTLTKEQIMRGTKNDTNQKWAHGLLLPIGITWWRWKKAGEDKATEITEAEYLKLPTDERGNISGGGEKFTFNLDLGKVNPGLQYPMQSYSTFRGFPDWKGVIVPSIGDATGQKPPASLITFQARAETGLWYVEAEILVTARKDDPSKNNQVPRFTRMTEDENAIIGWAKERFGGKPAGTVPDDILAGAENVWNKVAKKDLTRFTEKLQTEPYAEYKPYANQLVKYAQENWATE